MNMLSPPVTPVSGGFPGVRSPAGNYNTQVLSIYRVYKKKVIEL